MVKKKNRKARGNWRVATVLTAAAAGLSLLATGCSGKIFAQQNAYTPSEQAEVSSIAEEIAQFREDESRETAQLQSGAQGETDTRASGSNASAENEDSDVLEFEDNSAGGEADALIFSEIREGRSYTDKESVAYYIHTYGCLPPNYITRAQARKLGWTQGEDLWTVAYGKSIGGGIYNNGEGALPEATGRVWYECDLDYEGGPRNTKRLLYSNDGLIYYTPDNQNFEQLY